MQASELTGFLFHRKPGCRCRGENPPASLTARENHYPSRTESKMAAPSIDKSDGLDRAHDHIREAQGMKERGLFHGSEDESHPAGTEDDVTDGGGACALGRMQGLAWRICAAVRARPRFTFMPGPARRRPWESTIAPQRIRTCRRHYRPRDLSSSSRHREPLGEWAGLTSSGIRFVLEYYRAQTSSWCHVTAPRARRDLVPDRSGLQLPCGFTVPPPGPRGRNRIMERLESHRISTPTWEVKLYANSLRPGFEDIQVRVARGLPQTLIFGTFQENGKIQLAEKGRNRGKLRDDEFEEYRRL